MGLVNRKAAQAVKKEVSTNYTGRIATAFYCMMNNFHSLDVFDDYEIEKLLLKQQELDTEDIKNREPRRTDIVTFNPSSAGKCPRELYFKSDGTKEDGLSLYPYNKRWASNGTAVHSRIQRDLLYAQKYLKDNPFKVAYAYDVLGKYCKYDRCMLPAWENNIFTTREFNHNGQHFAIRGMADGFLWFEDKLVNLEIKTKSTTVAAVGTYKMKEPMEHHVMQCICYSLLFHEDPYEDRVDTSVLFYESLAKDNWSKGAEARPDIRAFQVNVTKEMRVELLDKFALVVDCINKGVPPFADTSKCLFCPYKETCGEGEQC